MIDLTNVKNIYLYTSNTDMRIGINKIELLLALSFSPIEIINSFFIFVSKNRKQIKIYYEDEFGKWLLINKLSYSIFQIPTGDEKLKITKTDLPYLLKGVKMLKMREKEIAV